MPGWRRYWMGGEHKAVGSEEVEVYGILGLC